MYKRDLPKNSNTFQEIGLITWNVNHLSAYRIMEELQRVSLGLQGFSEDDMLLVIARTEAIFMALLHDPDISTCMQDIEHYRASPSVSTVEFKKKYTRLQDPVTRIMQLCQLIHRYRHLRLQVNIFLVGETLNDLVKMKWVSFYQEAQTSRQKRVAFFDQIKKLQDVENLVDAMKQLLGLVREVDVWKTLIKRSLPYEGTTPSPDVLEALEAKIPRLPNAEFLTRLIRAMHSDGVVMHVCEMFETNADWLDMVLLQEVNDATLLVEQQKLYTIYTGPLLVSSGDRDSHQEEYFPLLIAKDAPVKVEDVFILRTSGAVEPVNHGQKIVWDKSPGLNKVESYRPIVIYQVRKVQDNSSQVYWIGVVHTTPERDSSGNVPEYNRRNIYGQLMEGLKWLSAESIKRNIPLIIGGDYYLAAESVVTDWGGVRFQDLPVKEQEELQKIQVTLQQEVAKTKAKLSQMVDIPENLQEWYRFQWEAARDDQVLRNACQLTMAAQMKQLKFSMAQPISGTNPKRKPLSDWLFLQIADFFVYNSLVTGAAAGILRPQGKIMQLDTMNLKYSSYWQYFSDHFPVGAIFSLQAANILNHPALASAGSAKAIELARISTVKRFARLQLKAEGKPMNLVDSASPDTLLQLAMDYLKGWQQKLRRKLYDSIGDASMDLDEAEDAPVTDLATMIHLIQSLEWNMELPQEQCLYITSPDDFEAEDSD